MGRKRKSDATRLDEVDRSMYTTFCGAANSLSQLYTQAMHQQRLSFQAGERHALEKLNNWILRQQEDGLRATIGDIFTYLQNELDYGTDEPPSSPRLPFQQHQQIQNAIPGSAALSVNAFGPATIGQGFRSGISDQTKNSVFSNALSSPVRRSLSQTVATKPEIQILPVPTTLQWIYILIALATILLAEPNLCSVVEKLSP